MLVVDENLSDELILDAVAKGYSGQVLTVMDLRPRSIIKDDAIATLLLKLDQPTFVTINVSDFWKKARPHAGYAIVCIGVPQDRAIEVLELLRPFLRSASFKTKAARMGKVFHLLSSHIEHYGVDRKIQTTSWLE